MNRIKSRAAAVAGVLGLASVLGCRSSAQAPQLAMSPKDEMPRAQPAESLAAGPVGDDYRVQQGDVLRVTVFDAPQLSAEATRVSNGGDISLPLLGPVSAEGRTLRELEGDVEAVLRDRYMKDPHVSIGVTERAVEVVYVVGAVNGPGGFPVETSRPMTVLQALALAQGLRGTAAKGDGKIIRSSESGERVESPIDLGKVLDGEAPDRTLQAGDVLFVPTSGPKSFLAGVFEAALRILSFRWF